MTKPTLGRSGNQTIGIDVERLSAGRMLLSAMKRRRLGEAA
ncbi:MAG: hypothetical protein ACQGVC_18020 [Myxococcota bacterium]